MIPQGNTRPEHDQFTVSLKCHRCGQVGYSVREENRQPGREPQTGLVNVSSGFYERLSRKIPHAIELVCHRCEAVQLG